MVIVGPMLTLTLTGEGVKKREMEIKNLLKDKNIDVLFLTETDNNSIAKTFIGLDKNPIYNIYEIQGLIKEFTNKKCALLSIFDNSN